MEAMRDVALAHYETLPDEEKVKIQNDFKTVEDGGVSEYIKSRSKFESEIVDECLKIHEGYKEVGSLDFKAFITLSYILENTTVRCDGCSSLILGRAFFSCEECFFNYPSKSYDLCSDCYRSKKFEDHNHNNFRNNQTLQYLSRRKFAEVKSQLEKRNTGIQQAMVEFYSAFTEFSRSVAPDLVEVHFGSVSYIDEELEAMPREVEEISKEDNSTEHFGIITPPMSPRSTTVVAFPRVDLVGAKPSLQP